MTDAASRERLPRELPSRIRMPRSSRKRRKSKLAPPERTRKAGLAQTARMIRGSMIDVLESDYIMMARLKGVPERRVVYRHALRNALVPRAPLPLGQARVGDLPNHRLRESELPSLWRAWIGVEDQ